MLIISKKWGINRGNYTSVERFCSILEPSFNSTHGKQMNLHPRIALWLKNRSNGRVTDSTPIPYNSYSAKIEYHGIKKAILKQPDIVFFPYADYDFNYFGKFKKLIKSKLVLWSFFSEWELNNRFKDLTHFKKADLILAAGHSQVSLLKKNLPNNRIEYFPVGVDTDFFKPGEKSDKIRIVQSGHNRRDFETAIKSLDLVYNDYPGLKVDFIGTYTVKDRIPDRDYIIIHEHLSDNEMLKIYQNASIQILPLRDGGSSNSLNEGMACGLPVVVTGLNNIRDYLDNSFSLLFEQGDYKKLYSRIMYLIKNKDIRNNMGNAARKHSLNFDWKFLKKRFFEITDSI